MSRGSLFSFYFAGTRLWSLCSGRCLVGGYGRQCNNITLYRVNIFCYNIITVNQWEWNFPLQIYVVVDELAWHQWYDETCTARVSLIILIVFKDWLIATGMIDCGQMVWLNNNESLVAFPNCVRRSPNEWWMWLESKISGELSINLNRREFSLYYHELCPLSVILPSPSHTKWYRVSFIACVLTTSSVQGLYRRVQENDSNQQHNIRTHFRCG